MVAKHRRNEPEPSKEVKITGTSPGSILVCNRMECLLEAFSHVTDGLVEKLSPIQIEYLNHIEETEQTWADPKSPLFSDINRKLDRFEVLLRTLEGLLDSIDLPPNSL